VSSGAGQLQVEAIEFPPVGYGHDDLRRMFPADVVHRVVWRDLLVSPDEEERLDVAAHSP
jgi:hypothetical protein